MTANKDEERRRAWVFECLGRLLLLLLLLDSPSHLCALNCRHLTAQTRPPINPTPTRTPN